MGGCLCQKLYISCRQNSQHTYTQHCAIIYNWKNNLCAPRKIIWKKNLDKSLPLQAERMPGPRWFVTLSCDWSRARQGRGYSRSHWSESAVSHSRRRDVKGRRLVVWCHSRAAGTQSVNAFITPWWCNISSADIHDGNIDDVRDPCYREKCVSNIKFVFLF